MVRGCLGNKGVVRLGVIETMRGNCGGDSTGGGNCNEDVTGGDGFKVSLGNGGISHGRGMRSSEEGMVIFLTGGNGMPSGC